jgi:hypothetical protein
MGQVLRLPARSMQASDERRTAALAGIAAKRVLFMLVTSSFF